MRLVFVHGIKHEGKSSEWIVEEWKKCLSAGVTEDADKALLTEKPATAPFYGDKLFELTETTTKAGDDLTPQGAGEVTGDEAEFYADALAELAARYPVEVAEEIVAQEAELAAQGDDLVAQGINPHNRRLLAVVRAIETLSPLHGDVTLRLLPQAFTYLKRAHATATIDDIVRPELEKGPCIVVAHSLGTVVSFKLLRELGQTVPFYMTIGSPLAIKAVQKPLKTPKGIRPNMGEWLNAYDRDDFVTIGKPLDGNFGNGMVDIEVENDGEDAHSHVGYFSQKSVADALIGAIRKASA